MRTRSNRFGLVALAAAIAPILGAMHLADDAGAGGGGGGAGANEEEEKKRREAEAAKRREEDPKKKTLTLTQEELDQKILDATTAALARQQTEADRKRREDEEKARRDQDAEKRKKAKEAEDYKALHESEETRNRELEAENASLKLENKRKEAALALRDYLAEKHGEYLPVAKYIMSQVELTADLDAKEITKRVGEAAEQYVKDNPRKVIAGAAPQGSSRGRVPGKTTQEPPEDKGTEKKPEHWPSRRGF